MTNDLLTIIINTIKETLPLTKCVTSIDSASLEHESLLLYISLQNNTIHILSIYGTQDTDMHVLNMTEQTILTDLKNLTQKIYKRYKEYELLEW